VEVGGRGDRGVRNADAVATAILKAVATGKSRDLEVDVPNVKEGGQALDLAMLSLVADARIQLRDRNGRDGRAARQAPDHLDRCLSIAQVIDEDTGVEKASAHSPYNLFRRRSQSIRRSA
jgi:hypothetical protein